jgi:hypothetical protein
MFDNIDARCNHEFYNNYTFFTQVEKLDSSGGKSLLSETSIKLPFEMKLLNLF